MMFTAKLLVSLISMMSLAQIHASPITEAETGLIVLQTDERADLNGTITWYGEGSNHKRTELAEFSSAACGTNDVKCATNQLAPGFTCQTLINTVRTNGAGGVPESPRAVCLNSAQGQCCISWSKAVPGLVYNNLYSAANSVFNGCIGLTNPSVSGFTENTSLNGVCLHQCLSNRPGGC
jgi:hypothetical protein